MLSHEAREHIGNIFAGQVHSDRNSNYQRAEHAIDATFSFYCGMETLFLLILSYFIFF